MPGFNNHIELDEVHTPSRYLLFSFVPWEVHCAFSLLLRIKSCLSYAVICSSTTTNQLAWSQPPSVRCRPLTPLDYRAFRRPQKDTRTNSQLDFRRTLFCPGLRFLPWMDLHFSPGFRRAGRPSGRRQPRPGSLRVGRRVMPAKASPSTKRYYHTQTLRS